jgi:hypothetical protein
MLHHVGYSRVIVSFPVTRKRGQYLYEGKGGDDTVFKVRYSQKSITILSYVILSFLIKNKCKYFDLTHFSTFYPNLER